MYPIIHQVLYIPGGLQDFWTINSISISFKFCVTRISKRKHPWEELLWKKSLGRLLLHVDSLNLQFEFSAAATYKKQLQITKKSSNISQTLEGVQLLWSYDTHSSPNLVLRMVHNFRSSKIQAARLNVSGSLADEPWGKGCSTSCLMVFLWWVGIDFVSFGDLEDVYCHTWLPATCQFLQKPRGSKKSQKSSGSIAWFKRMRSWKRHWVDADFWLGLPSPKISRNQRRKI